MRARWSFVWMLLSSGCATQADPLVSPGRLGYLSDRAHELSMTIQGEATVDWREGCDGPATLCGDDAQLEQAARGALTAAAERHAARGEPLFPERARALRRVTGAARRADGRVDVRFLLDVTSFARDAEHPSQRWVYASDATTSFLANDDAPLARATPLSAASRDVTMAVVIGQIAAEAGDDDPARWSQRHLEDELVARGFARAGGRFRRGRLAVDVTGPDVARLSSERAADAVAAAFRSADVVYVSGHARSGLLANVERSERPSLVFLDLCWSYYLDAHEQRARTPSAAIVVTDGAVVTGSVDNVTMVVDGLLQPGAELTYRALLERLNDAAAARARERAGKVDPALAEPEVYGFLVP